MLGIDNAVIEHRLCVDPMAMKICQKIRTFSTEKCTAIAEEVDRLLAVGFIRETYFQRSASPTWCWLRKQSKNGECVKISQT